MYKYSEMRSSLFTEIGQIMFMSIRDNTHELIKKAGAVSLQKAISSTSGDTWMMLACVDRLVELGEITEIEYGADAGQYRLFVKSH